MKQQSESAQKDQDRRILAAQQPKESDGGGFQEVITKSSHPNIASLHVVLKIAIVFVYLIFPFITSPFNVLVIVAIAAAVDFWVVKNLSGRLLVGLRWWVDFEDSGDEQWRFQCKVNEKEVSQVNLKAFWWTMVIFGLIWAVLAVINTFKFDVTRITICLYCFALIFFNLYSYYRCSKVQKQHISNLVNKHGRQVAAQYMGGSFISAFK